MLFYRITSEENYLRGGLDLKTPNFPTYPKLSNRRKSTPGRIEWLDHTAVDFIIFH